MTRDELLSTQIKEALDQDERVSAESIAVKARHGIVTLEGNVPTFHDMQAAIEIVASFRTCRGVVNRQILARVHENGRHDDTGRRLCVNGYVGADQDRSMDFRQPRNFPRHLWAG